MVKKIRGRCLFWLDAHYSGKGTAKGDKESSISHELDIIKTLKNKDHVILIDDAREFTGKNDYPTLDEVKKKLTYINPKFNIFISYDCIIALPQ